jgi:peptidoglycan/xylan/chitin deacetylase (PgdA/CDA1 family)
MRLWLARRAAVFLALAVPLALATGLQVGQSASAAGTNTLVTLTFDDGSASQYSTLSMLASRGMTGTYYINSALVGSSSYYMTWPQIHALADAGNEIGGHTLHHTNLTRVDLATAQREVCDDRQSLLNQGFSPVVSFAYPEAATNATAEQVVQQCGYTTGRGVGNINSGNVCGGCPYAETIPPGDAFALDTPEPAVSGTTLSQLQSYVTGAETHGGGWVVLVFHGICDNGCAGTNSLSPSTFTAFLDWLQPRSANGTVVRTVAQVMGAPVPPGIPSTSISCSTAPPNFTACSNSWYKSPVNVTLTAAGGTGPLTTRYTTDGSDPSGSPTATTYTGPFGVAKTTTVRYYSTDATGTAETTKSQLISIDLEAPSVALTSPTAGSYRRGTALTLEATATDNGTGGGAPSGVARVVFLDGTSQLATVTTPPYRFAWNKAKNTRVGDHTLTAVVTDVAGNAATSAPVTVTITR